ncbi:hypothetical protein [Chondromyces apiculatus]|nr:hypothetical protein [Chondromyces apiculatus]
MVIAALVERFQGSRVGSGGAVAAALAISLAGCGQGAGEVGEVGEEALGEVEQSLVTKCSYLDPGVTPPLPVLVDFARELVITDLKVVEDPCRTTWTTGCASAGAWTFGRLMMDMAGTTAPATFVAEWLHQWETTSFTPTGVAVPPRPGIRPLVIDPWLTASGCAPGTPLTGAGATCTLDLKQAPFRLLAIVNRIDQSGASASGVKHSGEARFVFGFLDAPKGNPLQATVILEYKVPPRRKGVSFSSFDWAKEWHVLSNPSLGPIGAPPYLKHLEGILKDITSPGVMPGARNLGSAIGQVRTNEIDFAGGPWKLREHTLQNVGLGPNAALLKVDTLKLTPDDGLLFSTALDTHLQGLSLGAGSTVLTDYLHTEAPDDVPAGMLAGESSAPFLWDHSAAGTLTVDERHHFGLATCNGCHLDETSTPFVHIAPRPAGVPSALSPFLSTSTVPAGGGAPLFAQSVFDPAGSGTTFMYNEPWRRLCEVTRILNGDPMMYTRENGAH